MTLHPFLLRWCSKSASKLFFFIQMQLFMMLVSLPILVAWGLPLSIMSIVGNLIFSPFLIIFLLISCLIFFFELCCLPNSFLIMCLEQVTQLWSWCVSHGASSWLIGFKKPPLWVLWIIIVGLLSILHHKKLQYARRRFAALVLFLLLVFVTLKFYALQKVVIKDIPCALGSVTALKIGSTVSVIDSGAMGKRYAPQWVEYTLVKEMVEQFGSMDIDHLILTRPTALSLEYAAQLCSFMNVHTIYLVTWRGDSEKKQLWAYGRLRAILAEKKGSIIRISKNPIRLNLTQEYTLMLEPQQEQLIAQNCTFYKTNVQLIKKGSATLLVDLKSS